MPMTLLGKILLFSTISIRIYENFLENCYEPARQCVALENPSPFMVDCIYRSSIFLVLIKKHLTCVRMAGYYTKNSVLLTQLNNAQLTLITGQRKYQAVRNGAKRSYSFLHEFLFVYPRNYSSIHLSPFIGLS